MVNKVVKIGTLKIGTLRSSVKQSKLDSTDTKEIFERIGNARFISKVDKFNLSLISSAILTELFSNGL